MRFRPQAGKSEEGEEGKEGEEEGEVESSLENRVMIATRRFTQFYWL